MTAWYYQELILTLGTIIVYMNIVLSKLKQHSIIKNGNFRAIKMECSSKIEATGVIHTVSDARLWPKYLATDERYKWYS